MAQRIEDLEAKANTITDEEGNEFVQRPIALEPGAPKRRGRKPKPKGAIRVYNKARARLFLHDGRFLEPESEGEVTPEDMQVRSVRAHVIEIK
jgi:hypothetical protein